MHNKISGAKIRDLSESSNLALFKNVDLAPSKYNGGQLYATEAKRAKYCINIDWAEFTTRGIIIKNYIENPPQRIDLVNGGYLELAQNGGGTRHYRFIYKAFAHGDEHPFAQVLTAPRKGGVLDADLSQVKVLNHALYTDGWTNKLYSLLTALNLKINNCTRTDIAIDGHGLLPFILQYDSGKVDKIGRVSKYTLHKGNNRQLTGYDWGSRKGEKYLTCYNKSARLESAEENKSYIREFWQKNGLDISNDVERFELKMKAKILDRIVNPQTGEKGLDILRLEESDYLAGIVESQLDNFFQFVPSGADKNISRRKEGGTIEVIDFKELKRAKMIRLSSTKPSSEKYRAKIACKKLSDDAKRNNYLQDALRAYFRKTDYWTIPNEILDEIPSVVAFAMANEHDAGAWLRKHIDGPTALQVPIRAAS